MSFTSSPTAQMAASSMPHSAARWHTPDHFVTPAGAISHMKPV